MRTDLAGRTITRLEALGFFELGAVKEFELTQEELLLYLIRKEDDFAYPVQRFIEMDTDDFVKAAPIYKIALRSAVNKIARERTMETLKGYLNRA